MAPGLGPFLGGVALCAFASLLSWGSYSDADPGESYTVWTGGIFVGALIALGGAIRLGRYGWSQRPDASGERRAHILVRSILHACAYVAAADADISHEELRTIAQIIHRTIGVTSSTEQLHQMIIGWSQVDFRDSDFFVSNSHLLTRIDRLLIVRCALLVGTADGPLDGVTLGRVQELATGLGIWRETLNSLRDELGV